MCGATLQEGLFDFFSLPSLLFFFLFSVCIALRAPFSRPLDLAELGAMIIAFALDRRCFFLYLAPLMGSFCTP